jgi:phosphate transport system protein
MGDLVLGRLDDALTAMADRDDDLARDVVQGDDEINERYLDLERDCIDLLALQQPVASDLRLVAASFKIITDLERVGDLATNLAGYALDADRDVYPEVDVQAIGDETSAMLRDALDAYAAGDADAAHAIADRDDHVDDRCENAAAAVVRDLVETELATTDEWEYEDLLADVSRLLLTIRDLERVGDHAVNIAARTLYMVESDDQLLY